MSTDRDTTRLVRSWLEEGVTALPDRVLDAVLDHLPATPQRRRFGPVRRSFEMHPTLKYALAAAAVLLIAFVGIRLVAPVSNVGPPLATVSPPATSSPAPTAMAIPAEGPLVQGTYVQTSVEPLRITFTVPSGGWQVNRVPDVMWTPGSDGRFSFAEIDNLYADPCDTGAGLRNPGIGATVDDLATALATLPGLDPVTPSDVTVAGYAGKLVEIQAPATTASCGDADLALFSTGDEAAPLDGGARHRFWVLDAEGTRLVIHFVERAELQTVWRNELEQILDSITID
jgi:hypothetical protein